MPGARYRANVEVILDDVVRSWARAARSWSRRPDYTVTPSGGDVRRPDAAVGRHPREQRDHHRALATSRGIAVVDIHDLSLRAAGDRSLVATDGLHPSGAQYALWVDRIAPSVEALLGR